jgi:hypothetical protein
VLLYVWVASWEFECCRDDAVIGSHWGGSLILEPAKPWWSKDAPGALPDDVLDLGVSEFDGDVARAPDTADLPAVVSVGSARVGVLGTITSGTQHFVGRLSYEGHGGGAYDAVLDELACNGIVRRVRGISYDYELRHTSEGEARVPIARHVPIDLKSTGDRYPTGRAGHPFVEYLIDLEID